MKAQLIFDLPEEEVEFKAAQHGGKLMLVMQEFLERSIRQRLKYESDKYSESQLEVIHALRGELYSLIDEYGIDEVIF